VPAPPRDVDVALRGVLAMMAPGTAMRDGLERILRGRTGALIVYGYDKTVESILSGGFALDVDFTATRLRELCKMDGALVIDPEAGKVIRANVQLVPDHTITTEETGTRHRTAERVAKQTGLPVISVSQSLQVVALYFQGRRYVLEDSAAILSRANQALATLERYKQRLNEVSGTLTALEIEDLVTVRDAAAVAQRLEMVLRIAAEIEGYVIELGSDGRLLALQLDELVSGVEIERQLVARDYLPPGSGRRARKVETSLAELDELSAEDLLDLGLVAKALGHPAVDLESSISPRGHRLLAKVPRLPAPVAERIVDHFGGLQKMLAAGIDDLQVVEGVGESRARTVREGLSRLAESSILERYV
jgi:diadenylate cyclase